jgi:hypothetical protein
MAGLHQLFIVTYEATNTLLNSDLKAFVADFGVARLLDPDSSNNVLFLMDPTGILSRVKIFLVINYTVYHHSYTDSYMVRKTRILSKRN